MVIKNKKLHKSTYLDQPFYLINQEKLFYYPIILEILGALDLVHIFFLLCTYLLDLLIS
jgi:hypothetical protein